MKARISSYLEIGNTFLGVEYTFQNGKPIFNVLELKKSNKKLEVLSKNCFDNLDNLANHIGKDNPVSLIINNTEVLIKKIISNNQDDTKILREAFPNLNKDEFYFEILKQNSTAFVSICRKDVVNNILEEYDKNRINVIDFFIGNLAVSKITSFFETTDSITTSNGLISLVDEKIHAIKTLIKPVDKTYNINGLVVSSKYLLAFSGALKLALNNTQLSSNFYEKRLKLKENFKHKRIFKLASRGIIVLLLTVLTINFLFYNHYFNEVNDLKSTSKITTALKEKMTELAAKVSKSKKKIEDVQRVRNSKASYYINDIIINLPKSLSLIELNYQPLKKKIQLEKPIENQLRILNISGQSLNSEKFSIWLTQLEKLKWVEVVDILNYKTVNNGKSNFVINIKINEKT